MVDLQSWTNWRTDSINPTLFNHEIEMMMLKGPVNLRSNERQALPVMNNYLFYDRDFSRDSVQSWGLLGSKFLVSPASYRDCPTA